MAAAQQLMTMLRRTEADLVKAQLAIGTGKGINKPSDAPGKTSAILLLQRTMDARAQQDRNLDYVISMLNNVDQALADSSSIVVEAKSLALSQIGVGSDTETRKAQAAVIDAQIAALTEIANRRVQEIGLFNGSANGNGAAFVDFLGGIRYVGATTSLTTDAGLREPLAFNANGVEVFNALGARVQSVIDLNPQATAATRVVDVNGAQDRGVRLGSVQVNIDGANVTVDLASANTLGDVVTRIQAAIDSVDPAAGTVAVDGNGFTLTAAGGHTASIGDIGAGQTAADLGIRITSADGIAAAGGDVNPRLTEMSQLAAFGAAVDFAGGLKITQGGVTKVADFSNAQNVRDMMNVIDQLELGIRLQINEGGTGFNLISEVSGIELSIGENAGGTTAGDLGLRTFGADTALSAFNHGLGVSTKPGQDDLQIALHDGRSFNVNLDAAVTVQDVIDTIAQAATAAGVDFGTEFNMTLAADGNGFVLTDNTVGGSDFRVTELNQSLAATNLGIKLNGGANAVMQGEDRAKVQVESVFTHLINLRNSLLNDDSSGIALAVGNLETDVNTLARARAEIGVRTQRAERALERSAELSISEQTLLSDLEEGDITQLIVRFTQLQQQYQASLQAGAQNLQLSLLDFLR